MPELRKREPLHGELDGGGRAWHREEYLSRDDSGGRSRQHRGGTDLLVRQHAEELAEAFDLLLEE